MRWDGMSCGCDGMWLVMRSLDFFEGFLNVLYTKDVSSLTKEVLSHPQLPTYAMSKMNSVSNTSAFHVPVMKEPFNWFPTHVNHV